MTDADGNFKPLVEDDQGEGVKDFVDDPQAMMEENLFELQTGGTDEEPFQVLVFKKGNGN